MYLYVRPCRILLDLDSIRINYKLIDPWLRAAHNPISNLA
jgi:hypothetical protein